MMTQAQIIDQAHRLGFEDVGFTSAAPFDDHKNLLAQMAHAYDWADAVGLDLKNGVNPGVILPGAKTIIVLIEPYFNRSYPPVMEAHFGRCYLDDDRVKGMAAWAMGQIGDNTTAGLLETLAKSHTGPVREEILLTLRYLGKKHHWGAPPLITDRQP
jgi:hypothetical protein